VFSITLNVSIRRVCYHCVDALIIHFLHKFLIAYTQVENFVPRPEPNLNLIVSTFTNCPCDFEIMQMTNLAQRFYEQQPRKDFR